MSDALPVALRSLQDFLDSEIDYLVVGGGTAGLVVAARLSEDPTVRVGVLEAGDAFLEDESLLTPAGFVAVIENPDYDWQLQTVPQKGTYGIRHSFPRGKVLGGSSAVNYLQYIRGHRDEYDDWNKVTHYTTWDWDHLKPYFLKHEGFHDPPNNEAGSATDKSCDAYAQIKESTHATAGPIRTSFPTWTATVEKDWHDAARATSDAWTVPLDAWDGNNVGAFTCLATIDRTNGSGTRSYATTGYFLPYSSRSNLLVFVKASAERICLQRMPDETVRATGVVFSTNGNQYTKKVRREVILAAGVVQSPQLLELSGIGRREHLQSLGIECIVDNDQVGENLEDHACTSISFEVDRDTYTNEWMSREDVFRRATIDYESGRGGPIANPIGNTAFLPLTAVATTEEMNHVLATIQRMSPDASDISRSKRDLLVARVQSLDTASLQLTMLAGGIDASKAHSQKKIFTSGTNAISVMIVLTHPFSRGSIHISSRNPAIQPDIDPGYLDDEVDTVVLVIGLRFVNDIFSKSPLKQKLVRRIFPSPEFDMSNLEALKAYVRGHTVTSYHPIGTAALGQVVDERLKVRGISGLRVVDASVFPLHISGNIVASVYAVAEKAADIIKENAERSWPA